MCIRDSGYDYQTLYGHCSKILVRKGQKIKRGQKIALIGSCLLYTSDAADERSSVDLGGRRIIKKKKEEKTSRRQRNKKDKNTQERA